MSAYTMRPFYVQLLFSSRLLNPFARKCSRVSAHWDVPMKRRNFILIYIRSYMLPPSHNCYFFSERRNKGGLWQICYFYRFVVVYETFYYWCWFLMYSINFAFNNYSLPKLSRAFCKYLSYFIFFFLWIFFFQKLMAIKNFNNGVFLSLSLSWN